MSKASSRFPGPRTRAELERGVPLFRNGLRYQEELQKAGRRGFRSANQVVIDRASGDFIWDMDGKRYIDFQNGWATNPLGNAHPEIIDAVDAAHRRFGFHYDHPLRYELAEKLAELMPARALPRFNYEVSGTEAAEAAHHLALCYTRRRYVISFAASYHGNGFGTKILSGDSGAGRYLEAWQGGVIKAPFPFSDQRPAAMAHDQYAEYCLWYLEHHIPKSVAPADNIAAVFIEPGLAEGGNWIPPREFMRGLRELCDRLGWLLIADEVLTGLGRTGKMWAVEHYELVPDILVVGKNLSGGIAPVAGIAARDEILGDVDDFSSGSTFAGTPAGCAAGLKTLEIYERDGVLAQATALGEIASAYMSEWSSRYAIVKQVRTSGLLIGVDFFASEDHEERWWTSRAVRSRMLDNGVWAISDRESTIRLYPSLVMDKDVLLEGLSIMEEAIQWVSTHGQSVGDSPGWPSGVAGF